MQSLADIAGDNAVHHIVLDNPASWVQFAATGTGTAKISGSDVSSTRGIPVAAGAGWLAPDRGRASYYSPGEFYAYIPTGCTLSVGYGA